MKTKSILFTLFIFTFMISCEKENTASNNQESTAYRKTMTVSYNNLDVDVIVDKPIQNEVDVLVVFHGTVLYDSEILNAANTILDNFKNILDRNDMMLVSVAYPGENLLLGDTITYAEAALLWVKNNASEQLGITINKVFLAGHSQGGYLVTRLNTMHQTNGVIANAPGPLNLVYRCQLEENGQIPTGVTCTKLKNVYGTTTSNPNAYMQRSLLNFTNGFQSDILFVQGLNDSPIQMYSWPSFKVDILSCTSCQNSSFVEIPGGEHASLFSSPLAKTAFNNFIASH
ncbi:alpha/beta hydrolase family protein [Flavobacterium difficile]|uniref:Alpha/beta hydrolase fold domain-containing protein n=1 Tax=Flavobacterium difficile TaxID=2709659 RepID=A0ABX0I6T4_9FLAO|nr:alpha/beta hydrolase fold domain-containing protein [Flavobacterium difficile]NHM01452.1 alpha/beta hydrolase fold domain-containing protein [Flavobacterium difficile]